MTDGDIMEALAPLHDAARSALDVTSARVREFPPLVSVYMASHPFASGLAPFLHACPEVIHGSKPEKYKRGLFIV